MYPIFKSQKGAALLQLIIILPLLFWLWMFTMDGVNGKYAAVKTKMAVNRAVKGAVLAIDTNQLATGVIRLDEAVSRANFDLLLKENLALDNNFVPTPSSPLAEAPEVLRYYIYQGAAFPYTYNTILGISHTFQNPGVLAVIKIKHKYLFSGKTVDIYAYSSAEVQR